MVFMVLDRVGGGGTVGSLYVPGACSLCPLTYSCDLNGDQQEGTSSFELYLGCDGAKLLNLVDLYFII